MTEKLWTNDDLIIFHDKTSNLPIKKQGIKVGLHLVVGIKNETYWIYKLHNGKHLLEVSFQNLDDAVRLAQWLDMTFSSFFVLWNDYPDIDIFGWAKWTVPEGIRLFETLNKLSKYKIVRAQQIREAWLEAEENVVQWTRNLR